MFLSKFLKKKRFISLFILCSLLFVLVVKPIFAFSTPTGKGGYLSSFETAVFQTEEMNLQSFVNEAFKATIASVWTSIVGCWSCSPEEREQYPGVLISLGGVISTVYATPPASGVYYLAHLGNKLNLVQPAYAQEAGTGFNAMSTILPVWEAFRNLSYSFFVIIFVIIGFAIMFRVKISPQAVITIESALPKIIIGLLLITFSYAIVGFMIDIMLVLTLLIASIFEPLLANAGGDLLLDLVEDLFPRGAAIALSIIPDFVKGAIILTTISIVIMALLGAGVGAAGGALASLWTGPTAAVGAGIGAAVGSTLFALIFILLLLIVLIRCLWTLLKAFINVILATIFGPFMILVGVLPGSNAIKSWFTNLLSNIAVIPIMFTMFLLASFFGLVGIAQLVGSMASASTVNVAALGLALTALGALNFSEFFNLLFTMATQDLIFSIFPFIGLGILFLAPRVADIIQATLSGQPFAYGTAIGQTIMGPTALFRYGVGALAAGTKIGEAWTTRLGLRGAPTGSPGGTAGRGSVSASYPGAPPAGPSV